MFFICHLCQSHLLFLNIPTSWFCVPSSPVINECRWHSSLLVGYCETGINTFIENKPNQNKKQTNQKSHSATDMRIVSAAVFNDRTRSCPPSFFPLKNMYPAILQAQMSTSGTVNCCAFKYSLDCGLLPL